MEARRNIFRDKVTSRERSKWLGGVKIASPLSHSVWALAFSSLGLIILAGLYFGEYTRREKAVGQLVTHDGVVRISSPSSGYVARVNFAEADSVQAGAAVIEIDTEAYAADGTSIRKGVSVALEDQQRTLRADIELSRDIYSRNSAALRGQIPLLESRLSDAAEELEVYRQEQVDQQLLLDRIEPLLSSGYISVTQVQQHKTALAAAKAKVRAQQSQMAGFKIELENKRAELARAPLDLEAQVNASHRLLASTDAEMRSNAGAMSASLVAPTDGTVSTVLVNQGQLVKPGQTLMTLVKEDSLAEAQLLVDSRSIGFVNVGTKVALRLRAYPFQKFGVLMGTVRGRSVTPLTPEEAVNRFGITGVTESMFLVRVELERQYIDVYGSPVRLTPGMYIDADLMIDRRRLYEWLFQPAYVLKAKGE
ncbi:HlyD family secretion protein [Stenotrophomonas maltophilia]|uniref:HlyD family secretion protein n=1 Tax=Stenotrophomonas maltophilia TaxID=40324 RepID=UPI000A3EECF6|nr:HlyD family efflux transporter periplasmic adaptor subunit [Stenotrophomonas maltophilia]